MGPGSVEAGYCMICKDSCIKSHAFRRPVRIRIRVVTLSLKCALSASQVRSRALPERAYLLALASSELALS